MDGFNENFQILKEIIKTVYVQIFIIENYGPVKHLYIDNERYVNAALENTIEQLEWAKEIISGMINNIYNLPDIKNKNIILGYLNKAYQMVINLLQYTYNVKSNIRFGQDDSILLNKYVNDAKIILKNIENLIVGSSKYI
jgi:hypothetical protein